LLYAVFKDIIFQFLFIIFLNDIIIIIMTNLLDISKVNIIRPGRSEQKFCKRLKQISKLAKKYDTYMAIDYEFNTKKIALMQIMFQIDRVDDKLDKKVDNPIKRFYILYPPELNEKTNYYLKKYGMSNLNITKILHGSESLDMPYITDEFYQKELSNKLHKVVNFFMSFVDTRYLCEYINLNDNRPNVCRIYELLENCNIITNEDKKRLEQNEQLMGPIYELFIDINNLEKNKELIIYAIHDVVYLVDLYKILKLNIIQLRAKDYFILIDSLRYSFMEKRLVSNIGDDIIISNEMNNYFFVKEKGLETIKLNQIFDLSIKQYTDSFESSKSIFKINYIKQNIQNLLKLILYNHICNKYTINATKSVKINYNLTKNVLLMYKNLKILKLYHLLNFIKQYEKYIKLII